MGDTTDSDLRRCDVTILLRYTDRYLYRCTFALLHSRFCSFVHHVAIPHFHRCRYHTRFTYVSAILCDSRCAPVDTFTVFTHLRCRSYVAYGSTTSSHLRYTFTVTSRPPRLPTLPTLICTLAHLRHTPLHRVNFTFTRLFWVATRLRCVAILPSLRFVRYICLLVPFGCLLRWSFVPGVYAHVHVRLRCLILVHVDSVTRVLRCSSFTTSVTRCRCHVAYTFTHRCYIFDSLHYAFTFTFLCRKIYLRYVSHTIGPLPSLFR